MFQNGSKVLMSFTCTLKEVLLNALRRGKNRYNYCKTKITGTEEGLGYTSNIFFRGQVCASTRHQVPLPRERVSLPPAQHGVPRGQGLQVQAHQVPIAHMPSQASLRKANAAYHGTITHLRACLHYVTQQCDVGHMTVR